MMIRGDPSTISCPVSIHQGKKVLVGSQLLQCCFTSATLKGETDWRGASLYRPYFNFFTSINKHAYAIFTRQIDSLTLAVTCSSSCSQTKYISSAACQRGFAVPAKTHVSGTVLPPLGCLWYCNAASLTPSIRFGGRSCSAVQSHSVCDRGGGFNSAPNLTATRLLQRCKVVVVFLRTYSKT